MARRKLVLLSNYGKSKTEYSLAFLINKKWINHTDSQIILSKIINLSLKKYYRRNILHQQLWGRSNLKVFNKKKPHIMILMCYY